MMASGLRVLLLMLAAATSLTACGASTDEKEEPSGHVVTLAPKRDTIFETGNIQLSAQVRSLDGELMPDAVVQWWSLYDDLVEVTQDGRVRSRHDTDTSVTVYAAFDGQSDTAFIRIIPRPVTTINVSVSPSVLVAESVLVSAETFDSAGSKLNNRVLTWGSAEPRVVSMGTSGAGIGRDTGTSLIGARNGAAVGSAPVIVESFKLDTLAGGETFSCGIDTEKHARCWGRNDMGQLGRATARPWSPVPVLIPDHQFQVLALGARHGCGKRVQGDWFCWGANEYGQTGSNNAATTHSPVAISGGHSFALVSAGGRHTCGLTTSGAVYCWGHNTFGQLGTGDFTSRGLPALTLLPEAAKVIAVAGEHTCALGVSGKVYCWGVRYVGYQLARPDDCLQEICSTPLELGNAPPDLIDLQAKSTATCGLTAGGSVWCLNGELASSRVYEHLQVGYRICARSNGSFYCMGLGWEMEPMLPGPSFDLLSAGSFGLCGLRNKKAFCWGFNDSGQLGAYGGDQRTVPVPVIGQLQ